MLLEPRLDDPRMCIGWTLEAREDEHGLFVRVQLDLDSDVGAKAYRMLQRGLVRQMSITYIVEQERPVMKAACGIYRN